jgi:formylglycine-generating enzyme required for sulfatase activity
MAKVIPLVFISSTEQDLKQYRNAARDAAIEAGFQPVMMEYFSAQGRQPPYAACMAKVDPCDVLIVIAAHRYGWVPADQPGADRKSITWLECEYAKSKKKPAEMLAFVVDEKYGWPLELHESYRITAAINEGKATAELLTEVQDNVARLKEFKQWLGGLGFRPSFTTADDLKSRIMSALFQWSERHPEFQGPHLKPALDPAQYLHWLREQTAWIDIRGLQVGSGKAHRFPICDLYIPLRVTRDEAGHSGEEALRYRKLVVTGDPGSGKTTFLRRIAYELCRDVNRRVLPLPPNGFPLFIRIAELEEHIRHCLGSQENGAPTTKESPSWIAHFLEHRSRELKWNLTAEFFEAKLGEPSTLLLLDGLDEAAGRTERESMARLLENATQAYGNCRFVISTRPGSYRGLATLGDFHHVTIADLEGEAVELFLQRWSENLYPENASGAESHCRELLAALRARIEIRRMARNPVMLTALAVVHWNEKRLPEQRADLYDSVLTWLSRSRELRPGRERAERCLALLGHLALAMQNELQGRLTQSSLGQAAEMISPQFRGIPPERRFACAQQFLSEEEADSGIVVSRGSELRFWHLTFQEFLAARAISGLEEASQKKLLLTNGKLYSPEWREVILLLAGILLVKQGPEKVDGLFRAVLDRLGDAASLADKAQCAGLLGAILADLRPLAYQPADSRYHSTLNAVLGIFDAKKADDIDLQIRLEAAEALAQAGDPRLSEDNNRVTISGGYFLMGTQDEDPGQPNYDPAMMWLDESPVHEVRLESYRIGRHPATVAEFRRFMEDDGYQNTELWKNGGFGARKQPDEWEEQLLYPNRPVVNVTWYEAAAWCAWAGGRLPTEAEWECAARGREGRMYPWGNEPPDPRRAGFDKTKIDHAAPIGLFPHGMTPEGVHDLAGNVVEWTADWYATTYYEQSPAENPKGPESGKERVLRGGSWNLESRFLRASIRFSSEPGVKSDKIGFRCVWDM